MLKHTIVMRDTRGIIARLSLEDVLYTLIAPRYREGSSPRESDIASYTVTIRLAGGALVTATVKSLSEAEAIAEAIFIGDRMDFDVLAVEGE